MPERELPEHLTARLNDELTAGAPLMAPLPSQARYAAVPTTLPAGRHVRWRLVSAVAAAGALVVVALATGPTPARQWLGQSVSNIAHGVQHDGDHGSGSPAATSPDSHPTSTPPTAHETPEATETPEPQQSPEPRESPEPSQSSDSHESPEPSQSAEPSPSPETSGGGE